MAFFKGSTLLKVGQKQKPRTVAQCGLCGLFRTCESPYMLPTGKGKKNIFIIGEGPGRKEDEKNKQFVGSTGQFLEETLEEIGIDMRRDCTLHNAVVCRPPNNRTPTDDEINYCHPNFRNALREAEPNVILAVGRPALQSVLQGIWTESYGPMGRWVGWKIPCRDLNTWVIPIYHPSYIQREEKQGKSGTPIRTIWRNHLNQLNGITGKPYRKVPDLKSKIEVLYDDVDIAKILLWFLEHPAPLGIDFETLMLKPDSDEGDIVTAGVSWAGKRTIAFPWTGKKTMEAFKQLMKSPHPKVAHNFKFDDRWYAKGVPPKKLMFTMTAVKNWVQCTMNTAHLIDHRREINDLSFQSFVMVGIAPYASHISPFLRESESYIPNKIMKEVEMRDLLFYNGLDAYCCIKVAMRQREILGLPKL